MKLKLNEAGEKLVRMEFLYTDLPPIFDNDPELNFNPFGGVNEEELQAVLVPHVGMESILEQIASPQNQVIELVGRKGRGKTSHLRLARQYFPHYPYIGLHRGAKYQEVQKLEGDVILVDSIHHLKLNQRIHLYKNRKLVVLTTHWPRTIEYWLAKKRYTRYRFRGIQKETLKATIRQRIQLAQKNKREIVEINEDVLDQLIHRFGDNYRGILNYLYQQVQKTNRG